MTVAIWRFLSIALEINNSESLSTVTNTVKEETEYSAENNLIGKFTLTTYLVV